MTASALVSPGEYQIVTARPDTPPIVPLSRFTSQHQGVIGSSAAGWPGSALVQAVAVIHAPEVPYDNPIA